jgi:hypothetical protein
VLEEEAQISANLQGPMQLYSEAGVIVRNKLYDGENFDETLGACPRTATDLRESRFESVFAFFLGE